MRHKYKKHKGDRDNFIERVEYDKEEELYLTSEHSWSPINYAKRNGIHERKDLIKLYKNWFILGKDMYVNGSARHRIVLKHYPELLYLLKIGFIEQVRKARYPHAKKLCEGKMSKKNKYYHNQTILRLKVK